MSKKAGGGCSKAGSTKDKPSQKAYTATMRWERNKRRRIEREAAKQKRDAGLREARRILRKRGALARLDRRIASARDGAECARLASLRPKVAAAAGERRAA